MRSEFTGMLSDEHEIMRFEFFGILKQMVGPSLDIALERPVRLRELLGPLSDRLEKMVPYGTETTEAQLMANLSFFQDGRMLGIDDLISRDDIITVMLPPTGG